MTLKVKNINSSIFTDANLNDMALVIPIGSSEEVYPTDYLAWTRSAKMGHAYTEINADRLICTLNDIQLSKYRSLLFLQTFYGQPEFPLSEDAPGDGSLLVYDSSTGLYKPQSVQLLAGLPYNMYYGCLGNISNSVLESAHGVSSSKTVGLCPFDMNLVGYSFSNSRSSVVTNLIVRKSLYNQGSTYTNVKTIEVRNARTQSDTNISPVIFNAGDKLSVYVQSVGTNPSGVEFILIFNLRTSNRYFRSENFIGDM